MGYASPLADLTRRAVRDAYGEAVTYTPAGGVAVSVVGIVRTESLELVLDPEAPPVATTRQVVDFRTAALDEAGITPRTNGGDIVVVASGDAEGTWRVIDLEHPCDGTLVLVLGRRS